MKADSSQERTRKYNNCSEIKVVAVAHWLASTSSGMMGPVWLTTEEGTCCYWGEGVERVGDGSSRATRLFLLSGENHFSFFLSGVDNMYRFVVFCCCFF